MIDRHTRRMTPFLKHRFVQQENKAEYDVIADIADFECVFFASKSTSFALCVQMIRL